jgi:hypothetical protein
VVNRRGPFDVLYGRARGWSEVLQQVWLYAMWHCRWRRAWCHVGVRQRRSRDRDRPAYLRGVKGYVGSYAGGSNNFRGRTIKLVIVCYWLLSAYRQHQTRCNLTSANDGEAAVMLFRYWTSVVNTKPMLEIGAIFSSKGVIGDNRLPYYVVCRFWRK